MKNVTGLQYAVSLAMSDSHYLLNQTELSNTLWFAICMQWHAEIIRSAHSSFWTRAPLTVNELIDLEKQ